MRAVQTDTVSADAIAEGRAYADPAGGSSRDRPGLQASGLGGGRAVPTEQKTGGTGTTGAAESAASVGDEHEMVVRGRAPGARRLSRS